VPALVTPISVGGEAQFRKTLDRFGYLDARYDAFQPLIKERDTLRKLILARHENDPADLPKRLVGDSYYVDLTARESQRKITSKPKAFAVLKKAMGITALVEALSYTLALIDKHLPEEAQKSFTETSQTGPRGISSGLIVALEAA
jgi:hypothetical protein